MLKRFAVWFASSTGVWQTVAVCLGWVVVERLFPQSDPNGFLLLYVLTVYSAITQPILAYSNKMDTDATDRILQELRTILDRIESMERAIAEDVEDVQESLERNE